MVRRVICLLTCFVSAACTQLTFGTQPTIRRATLIVFSRNRALQLYALLESVEKHMLGIDRIFVIYRSDSVEHDLAYGKAFECFPKLSIVCLRQGLNPKDDFKSLVLSALDKALQYVIFAVDDIVVKDDVDLSQCIKELETTGAHGFYLRLGRNITQCYSERKKTPLPKFKQIAPGILSWKFIDGSGDWAYPCSVDMTLCRKSDVLPLFKKNIFTSPNTLEGAWARVANLAACGLCFDKSKIVNIPACIVQADEKNRHMSEYSADDLLTKFNEGLKIDIQQLYQVNNDAPHHEFNFTFVPRVTVEKKDQNFRIGFLIMATGRYIEFVSNLIKSARQFFCKPNELKFFVFTDQPLMHEIDTMVIAQKRLGWPRDTLERFHVYEAIGDTLRHYDYLFACDADMLFVAPIGDEVLRPLTAVQHPGFVGRRGTYESNPRSKAFVKPNEGATYVAGGFYGGCAEKFLRLLKTCKQNVDLDLAWKHIAIWHDESHINRFFIDNQPHILSAQYCVPEEHQKLFPGAKLLALCKDHAGFRK